MGMSTTVIPQASKVDGLTITKNDSGEISLRQSGLGSLPKQWGFLEEVEITAGLPQATFNPDAYDEYLVVLDFSKVVTTARVWVQLNGETSTNYNFFHISSTTPSIGTNEYRMELGEIFNGESVNAEVKIKGSKDDNGGFSATSTVGAYSTRKFCIGNYFPTSATENQVTEIKLMGNTGSVTGKIKLYGR